MSRVAINTGSVPNDGTGDSLRIAGGIINDNFAEIYNQFGDGSSLTPTWDKSAAGINTTSNVGIGTTNPRFALEVGAVGASGTSLFVNGNARVTGILTVGSSSIILDGNTNKILVGSGISFDGNTGIISATAFYAGGSIISGGSGGGLNYWLSGATGITTTANVGVATDSAPSALTVGGNSLFTGIATFRNNVTLANLTSSSNTLRFGSNSYLDQSTNDVLTFQINSGTDGSGTDSSFVFRTTEPGVSPIPDQAYDALRVYSGGDYWNRLVRVYTNFHADNNAFVGGDLQVGAASTLIGAGSTLGSFKVGAGGTVITTTSTGLVGIGTTNPTSALTVKGNTSLETLNVSGVITATSFTGSGANLTSLPAGQLTGALPAIDGSALTGVVGSGSGVVIQDNGSTVGTAGTIDFSTNLSVSPISAGFVTVTATGGGGESYWSQNATGINTTSNVGIGTTTASSALTVKGNTSLETLNVSGVSTFGAQVNINTGGSSKLNIGAPNDLYLQWDEGSQSASLDTSATGNLYVQNSANGGIFLNAGTSNQAGVHLYPSDRVELRHAASKKFETLGAGVTVTGTTFTNQLSVSGVSTFSGNVQTNGSNIKLGDGTEGTGNQIKLGNGSSPDSFGDTSDFWIYHNPSYGNLFQDITGAGVEVWTAEFKVANPSNPSENVFYTIMNAGTELYYNRNKKFETLGAGVTVTGTTFTNQLSVSGVSTLSSNVSVGGTISVDGGVTLATNNTTIVGTSGTAGEIKQIAGAPFYYDGSAWREFVLSSGTPVTQPADTEWDNVIFRATFDDDFTDAKFGVSPVVVGAGASIVGAAVTIGTGAFRNTGIGISYAYRDDYDFTGSWTMEFWIYFDSAPQNQDYVTLVTGKNETDGSGNWSFVLQTGALANRFFKWINENLTDKTLALYSDASFTNVFLDKWNHIALVREGDSGDLHFYVNGIESSTTTSSTVIDNDILNVSGTGLHIGGVFPFVLDGVTMNSSEYVDAIFDDMRISAGVGTAGQRYNSIGISTYATFTPPTTALPTSGTLSSVVNPPGDKYGEITLGGSPSWRGTSGVTVSQQSSGNYRVSFASTYTNSNDYFVLSHPMDQGFSSYVGIARSTSHVDFSINKQSDDSAVDTGSLAVQIKNHP